MQDVIDYNGYEISIERDDCGESPREWDTFGTMVCFHSRYRLGDEHEFSSPGEFEEYRREHDLVVLPLYLYDHSGLTMNTTGFRCPWDSGQVGWIYADRETVKKEFGDDEEAARKCLVSEVETFDQYLRGDVWGYVVTHRGRDIDSCWGFYGREDMLSQARAAVDADMCELVEDGQVA